MSYKNKRPPLNLRAEAAKVLFQILEEGKSARECLPVAQEKLKDQDKAWLQEMTYGVLRNLPILQYWLRQLLDKPLKNRFKIVEHVIMLGFYQLAFTRVSQHAAVSETVAACQTLNTIAMKGLVNAILRTFLREEGFQKSPPNEQIASALPKWLFKKLKLEYKEELTDIVKNMQEKAPIWLRVNPLQISTEKFKAALELADIEYQVSNEHVNGIVLTSGCDVTTLPGFEQGWFAVQDGAAQLAATYLSPQAGENILDCCAAPGGKTCHIIELQPNLNLLSALEVDANRAKRIEENLVRLKHSAKIIIGDASQPNSWWDGQQFDRILLDAPCSATGIIRRHPDVKWLRKASDIEVLVELQKQIIDAIWLTLKPGGTLLYATCSILPEENHLQISHFLSRTPDAQLDPSFSHDSDIKPGRQILSGEKQMDGFYYARLLKSAI